MTLIDQSNIDIDELDFYVDPFQQTFGSDISGFEDDDVYETEELSAYSGDRHLSPVNDAFQHEANEYCGCGPSMEVRDLDVGYIATYTHHFVGNGH